MKMTFLAAGAAAMLMAVPAFAQTSIGAGAVGGVGSTSGVTAGATGSAPIAGAAGQAGVAAPTPANQSAINNSINGVTATGDAYGSKTRSTVSAKGYSSRTSKGRKAGASAGTSIEVPSFETW